MVSVAVLIGYTLNEVPHPQLLLALGLLKMNPFAHEARVVVERGPVKERETLASMNTPRAVGAGRR
jgi:hypothetical protein